MHGNEINYPNTAGDAPSAFNVVSLLGACKWPRADRAPMMLRLLLQAGTADHSHDADSQSSV